MFDPVKKRRINWGWAQGVHAGMPSSKGELGFGPGSAQTLAREVMWDPAIRQLVSPPVEEQEQLRGEKIASVQQPMQVRPERVLALGKSNQSEIVVTFQLPSSSSPDSITRFGVVVMGGADGGLHSGTFVFVDYAPPADDLEVGEVYNVSVGVQSLDDEHAERSSAARSSGAAGAGSSLRLLVGETDLHLRLFVDHSFAVSELPWRVVSIYFSFSEPGRCLFASEPTPQEAYWQDGRVAMTLPFKPTAEAAIAAAAPTRSVVVQSASVWAVESIWVAPEELLHTPRQ